MRIGPSKRVPPPAPQAPRRTVFLAHTPRPTGPDNTSDPPLPRGPVGSHALAYLDHPCITLPLLGQRPPPEHSSGRQPQREPLLPREGYGYLCPRLGRFTLPPELMDPGGKVEGIRQAERMRELLGQGQRLMAPLEGLVWIPQQPERSGHIGEEKHAKVIPKAKG